MSNSLEYQKGYRAGRRKLLQKERELRKERVYLKCLDMALKYCSGWGINKKEINNAEGFCQLAKIFADNSISKLDS